MKATTTFSVKEAKKAVRLIMSAGRVPFLVGNKGGGKSSVGEQIAPEDNKDCVVIYGSQLEPSEFLGLQRIGEDGLTHNCHPSFLPNKNSFNPKGGIVILEEFNRVHEDIRQAMTQFLLTGKIHTYSLPSNYSIMACGNTGDGYEVYELDEALVDRLAYVPFRPLPDETLAYITGKHGSSKYLAAFQGNKDLIDYGKEIEVPELFSTPRTIETIVKLGNIGLDNEPEEFIQKILKTMVPAEVATAIMASRKEIENFPVSDIFDNYSDSIAEKITEYVSKKRHDILSVVFNEVAKVSIDQDLTLKQTENLAKAISLLPTETVTCMLSVCNVQDKDGILRFHPKFLKLMGNKELSSAIKAKIKNLETMSKL
jgi:MoxR-like ATPase